MTILSRAPGFQYGRATYETFATFEASPVPRGGRTIPYVCYGLPGISTLFLIGLVGIVGIGKPGGTPSSGPDTCCQGHVGRGGGRPEPGRAQRKSLMRASLTAPAHKGAVSVAPGRLAWPRDVLGRLRRYGGGGRLIRNQ